MYNVCQYQWTKNWSQRLTYGDQRFNFQPLIFSIVKDNKKGNRQNNKTGKQQLSLSKDSSNSNSRNTQSCCVCQKELPTKQNISWTCCSNSFQRWHISFVEILIDSSKYCRYSICYNIYLIYNLIYIYIYTYI